MNLALSIGTAVAGGIWSILSAIDGFEKTGKNEKGEADPKKAKLSYIKIGRLIVGLVLMGFGIVSALGNQDKGVPSPQIVKVPSDDDRRKADSLQHLLDSVYRLPKPVPFIGKPDLDIRPNAKGPNPFLERLGTSDSVRLSFSFTNYGSAQAKYLKVVAVATCINKGGWGALLIVNSLANSGDIIPADRSYSLLYSGVLKVSKDFDNDTLYCCIKYQYKDSLGISCPIRLRVFRYKIQEKLEAEAYLVEPWELHRADTIAAKLKAWNFK